MDIQKSDKQIEDANLAQKRHDARIAMENEVERNRREIEEKMQNERKERENLFLKSEAERKLAEEKLIREKSDKETKDREQSKNISSEITREIEKIKSVGPEISSLRTFKTDMDDMVKEQNISLSRIAMQEEARRREMSEQAVETKSKNKIYIILSLLFIISGGVAGWYIYTNQTEPIDEIIVKTELSKPIIYAELKKEIDYTLLSKVKLLSAIKTEIFSGELEPGKVKNIILTKKGSDGVTTEANSATFLGILSSEVPDDFKRSLTDKVSIYSIAPINGEKSGAIVFETGSYQKTFSGMLKWEDGTLIRDLYELLTGAVPGEEVFALHFIDIVINNQDARMLTDPNSQLKIIYGFLDGKTIAITGNIDSYNEIITRFKNDATGRQ